MHRTIMVVDVEGFGDLRRTNPDKVVVRQGVYRAVQAAFVAAGLPWADCDHPDQGDAVFVLAPAEIPKAPFVEAVPAALAQTLHEHNAAHSRGERIRLRMVVHAGEVSYDEHGVTGTAINHAFRLLDAAPLKAALAESPGLLALIASSWFFDEVVRHSTVIVPATFRPVRVVVKETDTVGWIALPDRPYPADPAQLSAPPRDSTVPVPRQLPAVPRGFTGRAGELATLTAALDGAAGAGVISVLAGAGGIGKTWLALRWAHANLDRFPDGQLFVDLRGFSPNSDPLDPLTAARGFLDALGVDPDRITGGLAEHAALYRSQVAGKRMLIVLDNAASAAQVVPLLPGTATCAVLVTSRKVLTALIQRHGARHLPLTILTEHEACALLSQRLDDARVSTEPDAAAELIALCGRYPLALTIVAGRAHAHPDLPLTEFATDLRELGLEALDDADPTTSLPAVLSWSLRGLTVEQRTVFALLGIAPGPDIGLPAAASLTALPPLRVRKVLRELAEASLLERQAHGRHAMHDLIRAYATHVADRELGWDVREAALRRVVDFYTHTAHTADRLLTPHRPAIRLDPPAPGTHPQLVTDVPTALAWFDIEHSCLFSAQQLAAQRWHGSAWHLAWVLDGYHWHRGHLHDNLAAWRSGLAAADALCDPAAQALAHLCLGQACSRLGESDEAQHHLQEALALAEKTNDVLGQADALRALAFAWGVQGQYRQALTCATDALHLYQRHGEPSRTTEGLSAVGWFHACCGHDDQARSCAEQALVLARRHTDRIAESTAICTLALIANHNGRHDQALTYCYQALPLYRELGQTYYEAELLGFIGQTHLLLGQHRRADVVLRQALGLYRSQHRVDDAHRLQQQLATLGEHPNAAE